MKEYVATRPTVSSEHGEELKRLVQFIEMARRLINKYTEEGYKASWLVLILSATRDKAR